MKKTVSLLLAIIMIFSAFGMTFAFAEEVKPVYTVTFVDYDGRVISTVQAEEGETLIAPAYPTREDTDTMKYIFKGWKAENDDNYYHQNTIPAVSGNTTYTAVYSEQKIEKPVTFLSLIASIFARFNKLLEKIFGWIPKFEAA